MKNKKIAIGTMLLLFVLSGFFNVANVSAEQIEIPPTSWFSQGFDVDCKDELEIFVSSSKAINVYVMNQEQLDTLIDSDGLTWEYIKRWKDMTYLEYTYVIQIDGVYHVVIYNKNLVYSRIVDYQITVNYYYEPYEPYEPDDLSDRYFLERLFWWSLIIFVPIGIVSIVAVVFIKKHKRKTPKEPTIQMKEIPKIYCPECGIKIIDMTKDYCSQCGSKIIK